MPAHRGGSSRRLELKSVEVIPPPLTTFCPEVDFKIEALCLIHFEILGQTPSPFIGFFRGTTAES